MRKTVTVLFCDVVDSTALGETTDPEALQGLLARYFERMQGIVERHGGTVEKFIGDAVMAVFGVPAAHEDDAVRALRAAAEMRDALPELGVRGRIGVDTGEVIAGTSERLVTGDAVNVAARLQQAAEPNEVILGAATLALAQGAVDAEALPPLTLKGKHELVAAYRLRRMLPSSERRYASRFVGRQAEMSALHEAWQWVREEGRCRLVTIVAEAGIGKSRLVAEFLSSIEAHVVRGRCLSYGDGITYWPVVEVLKQLDIRPSADPAGTAIASVLGVSTAPLTTDEIAWAVRKRLEQAAGTEPLIVVFDDIQWGADSFLDLIEYVALMSTGAPILLLCMARPELLERRPGWQAPIHLDPLAADFVAQMMPPQVEEQLRERITRAAGGNPLYITEMLAMSSAGGDVVVPPTLKALLAARLDQLEPHDRRVLQCAAVEGEVFHRGAVQALSQEPAVLPRLASLVRKELIRPGPPQLLDEDGFRFRHLLIRDTAYEALTKRERAGLHESFAGWLTERGRGLVELDELIGYHLEQSWRYSSELGIQKPLVQAAALQHIRAAEERAMLREDFRAARQLAARALALVPAGQGDPRLEVDLFDSLAMSGDIDGAFVSIAAAREREVARGDRAAELTLLVNEQLWRMYATEGALIDQLEAVLDRVEPELEAAGDDLGLFSIYFARALVALEKGRADEATRVMEMGLPHCERLPPHCLQYALRQLIIARDQGSTSSSEFIAWLEDWDARRGARTRTPRRWRALARLGRAEEARGLLLDMQQQERELGNLNDVAHGARFIADIERLSGDLEAAEASLAQGITLLEQLSRYSALAEVYAHHGLALSDLGRFDEAEAALGRAESVADPADVPAMIVLCRCRAKVLAGRGQVGAAHEAAHRAVALADQTDNIDDQAEARADLAEILATDQRPLEAAGVYAEALSRFERKENLVMAARVRGRLEELAATGQQPSHR